MKTILIIIFLSLQYKIWFGEYSITTYLKSKQQIAEIEIANQKLEKINAILLRDIKHLKTDFEVHEEIARQRMGLIMEDEIFFRIDHTQLN